MMIGFNNIKQLDRNNLEKYLINEGQHKLGENLQKLIIELGEIKDINDIARMHLHLMNNFKNTKENHMDEKFNRTSEELVTTKTWSGCSNVGTIIAPILRANGIPTIYLQSARLDWVSDLIQNTDKKNSIRGHIFLEIFIDGEWLLFDSTSGHIYLNYDFNNLSLPKDYYAYSKSLTGHEVGSVDFKGLKDVMMDLFQNFDLTNYQSPNYEEISLKELATKKIISK